jgi:hypothetical protein
VLIGADLGAGTTIELGLVLAMAGGLVAIGGWVAILRHRQDQHGRRLSAHSERLQELERDKVARDAIAADRAGRPPASKPRPPEDSMGPI